MKLQSHQGTQQVTVGIGLTIHEGRVLLSRRYAPSVPEYHNHWELPGGKLEPGENFEAAIEREVKEETGFRVKCLQLLPFSVSRTLSSARNQQLHVIVIASECELLSSTQTPRRGNDATREYSWFAIDDIPFDSVVPGSREFLLCWLHFRLHRIPQPPPKYQIIMYYLPSENARANPDPKLRYDLMLEYDPRERDPFRVIRRWMNGERGPKERIDEYRRMDDAIKMLQHTLSKRCEKGYKMIFVAQNHPLRSWLNEEGIGLTVLGQNNERTSVADTHPRE